MPIVDGKYEAMISKTFASTEEAVAEITSSIKKSRRVRISGIPMRLLEELTPTLAGKDVKIILPLGEKPTDALRKLGDVAVTKAKIFKDYKGKEAYVGAVHLSDRIYNLSWAGSDIFEIDAMYYPKCVKCLKTTFETGWRYAKK